MNLGWKLAATVKGEAAPGLLDTYGTERHAIAAATLDWTRAQTAAIRPDEYGSAVRDMVALVLDTPDGAKLFADRFSGRALRYDIPHTSEDERHAAVGLSVPDFCFTDGTRLGEKLHHGGFVLVDLRGETGLDASFDEVADRLTLVRCECVNTLGFELVLVRPDGIIAWATDHAGTDVMHSLTSELERYLQKA